MAGILALKFFVLDLYFIEMALLLVVVGFCAIGCTQDIIRGLVSLAMLYIASGVAAISYRAIAPFGGEVNCNILALSFGLLTVVSWDRVLYLHYTAQSFWFPRGLPPIYAYDLDAPREH